MSRKGAPQRDFSRKSRIDAQLMRELSGLIRQELTDPRVAGTTVTRVDVSPDLKQAKISVSNLGDDASLKEAVSVLNRATGRLRHGLGDRLHMRAVPNLRFVADLQMREADRVNRLLQEALRVDAQHQQSSDGESPIPPAEKD